MKCTDIIKRLEILAPPAFAESWDNVGLLAGRRTKEIKKVYLAVDATDEVIEDAIEAEADMLLTHHPLMISGIKKVNTDSMTGKKIVEMIQSDICHYAMHTNYDVLGMADLSACILGLKETAVLEEVLDGEGIGRVGSLPETMTLQACAELVKERFHLPNVKVFGDLHKMVKTAAISPGSGKSMVHPALSLGAEVLITGDIDHHTGIDMKDCGLAIIDAGHYGIEHIYIEDMRAFLAERFPELLIETAPVCQPFEVL